MKESKFSEFKVVNDDVNNSSSQIVGVKYTIVNEITRTIDEITRNLAIIQIKLKKDIYSIFLRLTLFAHLVGSMALLCGMK